MLSPALTAPLGPALRPALNAAGAPVIETLFYSDGSRAEDLMREMARYGVQRTVNAMASLHALLHSATYQALLLDAARHGEATTVAAIVRLHNLIHFTLTER